MLGDASNDEGGCLAAVPFSCKMFTGCFDPASREIQIAPTGGEPSVHDNEYSAVLRQGPFEAMNIFIGRMLQAVGRQVDDARLQVPAARALRVGAQEGAFEWLQSDVKASDVAAEQARVPRPARASVCSANAHMPTIKNKREDTM